MILCPASLQPRRQCQDWTRPTVWTDGLFVQPDERRLFSAFPAAYTAGPLFSESLAELACYACYASYACFHVVHSSSVRMMAQLVAMLVVQ